MPEPIETDTEVDSRRPTPISTKGDISFEDGDIVLISVDGVSFKVHRWLLTQASEVFRDMLSLPSQLKSTNPSIPDEVQLSECQHTLKSLLCFLYPQFELPEPQDFEEIGHLLAVGDKYNIPRITAYIKGIVIKESILKKYPVDIYLIARRLNWPEVITASRKRILTRDLVFDKAISGALKDGSLSGTEYHELLTEQRKLVNLLQESLQDASETQAIQDKNHASSQCKTWHKHAINAAFALSKEPSTSALTKDYALKKSLKPGIIRDIAGQIQEYLDESGIIKRIHEKKSPYQFGMPVEMNYGWGQGDYGYENDDYDHDSELSDSEAEGVYD